LVWYAYSAKRFAVDPKKVYFDFSKDILKLEGSHYSGDWSTFHEFVREDLALVKNLVVDSGDGGDWSKIPDQLEQQLTPYIGLRHLTITSTQWDRPNTTKDGQKDITLTYKSKLTPVLNTIWHNICEKNGSVLWLTDLDFAIYLLIAAAIIERWQEFTSRE
jgi:hypothetical protein